MNKKIEGITTNRPFAENNYSPDLILLSLLLLVLVWLNYSVFDYFWLFDDLQVLKHAADHHFWEYFISPAAWRELSAANLTPLVSLSFDLDLNLFGLRPPMFYMHHLFSFWLAVTMLYAVLRLWVPRSYAFLGAAFFLFSAPAMFAAQFLCLRHYIEGSVLVLLSLILFVVAIRERRYMLSWLSALAYFGAMTAKEIYVPFLFIAFFLPEGKWSLRIRYLPAHVLSFLVYMVWRSWMLGRAVGGYQSDLLNSGVLREIYRICINNPVESIKMLAGNSEISGTAYLFLIAFTAGLLCLGIFFSLLRRRYSYIVFWAAVAASVYAPISPSFISYSVKTFDSYRFLFFFAMVYSCFAVSTCFYLSGLVKSKTAGGVVEKGPLFLVLAVVLLTSSGSYRWMSAERELIIKPAVAEGRFLMDAYPRSVMVKSSLLPWNTYYELMDFFRKSYKNEASPTVVYDALLDIGNRAFDSRGLHVYKYSGQERKMTEITGAFLTERTKFISRLIKRPLSVEFNVKKGQVDFALGPSDKGRYFLVAGYRSGIYNSYLALPRVLRNKAFPGKVMWYMRIGWESPEGGVTLSPEWLVDFTKDTQIRWAEG